MNINEKDAHSVIYYMTDFLQLILHATAIIYMY